MNFFDSDADWTRFSAIVDSWLGTPYRHVTMVKGRGADCALFIGACWKEAGILLDVTYDYYPKDWYVHSTTERVLDSLYRHFKNHAAKGLTIERHDGPLQRGDALALSMGCQGRVSNHTALYLGDDQVVHASPKHGVVKARFGHWMRPCVTNAFRVVRV